MEKKVFLMKKCKLRKPSNIKDCPDEKVILTIEVLCLKNSGIMSFLSLLKSVSLPTCRNISIYLFLDY